MLRLRSLLYGGVFVEELYHISRKDVKSNTNHSAQRHEFARFAVDVAHRVKDACRQFQDARRKLVEQAHGHADLARGEDNRSEVFQKDAPAAVALLDVKMTFAAAQSALPLHKQYIPLQYYAFSVPAFSGTALPSRSLKRYSLLRFLYLARL